MPAATLEPDLSTTLWATIWFALLPGSQQRLDLHSYMPSHSTLSSLLSSARPSANGLSSPFDNLHQGFSFLPTMCMEWKVVELGCPCLYNCLVF